jgi:hypothetical protein
VQRAVNLNRGGNVTPLKVPHSAGDTLYATREGVESQGWAAIETKYKVAWGAPILQDTCLHTTTSGSWQTPIPMIRSYRAHTCIPNNMDAHTKLLLLEVKNIFHRLSKDEVVNFVSTTDFQSFWQHANEDIQSSE